MLRPRRRSGLRAEAQGQRNRWSGRTAHELRINPSNPFGKTKAPGLSHSNTAKTRHLLAGTRRILQCLSPGNVAFANGFCSSGSRVLRRNCLRFKAIGVGRKPGTPRALAPTVTIAIPIWQNRVSPVLDAATRLLLVKRHRGREVGRKEIVLDPMPAADLATNLAGLGVDVLVCAAVSDPLLRALEARGVRVERHVCGNVEEVLRAFCGRQLWRSEFRMPGCWQLPTCTTGVAGRRRMRHRHCRCQR